MSDLLKAETRATGEPIAPATLVALLAQVNLYQGALPDPAVLRQYEQIVPGSAERLLRIAETQTRHRQQLERLAVSGEARRSYSGLIGGVLVVLAVVGVAGLAVTHGQPILGLVLAIGPVGSLAGVFVYGTNSRKSERIQKTQIMTEQIAKPMEDLLRESGEDSTSRS